MKDEDVTPPRPEGGETRIEEITDRYLAELQAGKAPDRKALLAAHPEIADALQKRLALVEGLHQCGTAGDDRPERIGPYQIQEVLGEGGMGIVYLAEQTEPVRRRVALKIMRPGMDTEGALARFESERQALALMDHPGIARVLDAGATEKDRPYFVMEYVPGIRITEYCDKGRLDTAHRLAIFVQVCAAVQHAHQKGIIHRDIKPSNLLVMDVDGRVVPKVIDFGVAKATHQKLTDRSFFTEHGRMVGTTEYMSPEQAEMSSLDVDTRTDIYSLGVVLYELLTGALPFSSAELREAGIDEIRRRIREEDPRKPSTKVSTTAGSGEVAQQRRTDTAGLARTLRGDLDWIVLKSLEKDRNRRYSNASDLAEDIRRYLDDEPVLASPPSTIYRLKKFVRKHRMGVAAALVVLLALVAGLVGTSAMYLRAERARKAEEAAKKEAERDRDAARKAQEAEAEQRGEAVSQRAVADVAREDSERESKRAREAEQNADIERHKAEVAVKEARKAEEIAEEERDKAEVAAEEARKAEEIAEEERDKAEEATKEAREAQRQAESRDVAREAISQASIDRGLGILLALEALDREHTPEAVSALWRSLLDGTPGIELAKHDEKVFSAKFHPDGKRVLTASADRTARLWGETGEEPMVLRGHTHWVNDASFSPDGEWIVTAGGNGAARLWRASDGEPVALLLGHEGEVLGAEFDPAGRRVVTASADGTARIWDVAERKEIGVLRGHDAEVNCAAFSPDGEWIVTGSNDKTTRIWEASSAEEKTKIRGISGEVFSARFGPEGERVIIASSDPTVRVWRRDTGELVSLAGHTEAVRSAEFSPDGKMIVSAGLDLTCRVWDVDTRMEVAVLRGHTDWVLSAAFSPDGKSVVTASADGAVRRFTADWHLGLEDLERRARLEVGSRVLTDKVRKRFIPWKDGP